MPHSSVQGNADQESASVTHHFSVLRVYLSLEITLIDKVCLRRLDLSSTLGIRVGGFCLYSYGFNRQAQKICQSIKY